MTFDNPAVSGYVRSNNQVHNGTTGVGLDRSENSLTFLTDCKVEVVDEAEIPPVRRCHFAAVATNTNTTAIYLMGGTTTPGRNPNCERLRLDQGYRQWRSWRRMNHSSRAHCCAVLAHCRIHVFGGIAFTGTRPACVESALLTPGPRFELVGQGGPDGRYRGSVAVGLGNFVYFMGGFLSVTGEYSQRVSMYDAVHRRWIERDMPDLPAKLAWSAATTLGDAIYVVGGTSSYSSLPSAALAMLSPTHQHPEWIELPPMAQGRYECAAVTVGRYIVVLGGRTFEGETAVILDSVEAYEVDTAQWIPLPSLAQPRAGFAAVVLSANEIVVLGGYNHEQGRKSLVSTVERITLDWGSSSSAVFLEDQKMKFAKDGKNLPLVDQWTAQVQQLTADCRASVEASTRRISEAQQVIQSQQEVVHNEKQRHEETCNRLYQNLQRVQREAQDSMEQDQDAESSSSSSPKKYTNLLTAIAEAHEVLEDLGRIRKRDNGGTSADDETTIFHRRASLRSFASTRRLTDESNAPTLAPPPNELLCPITLEIMQDPVLTCDGMTYERRAIERYLASKQQRALSPKTGQPLASKTLIPNIAIRNLCRDYLMEMEREGSTTSHGL